MPMIALLQSSPSSRPLRTVLACVASLALATASLTSAGCTGTTAPPSNSDAPNGNVIKVALVVSLTGVATGAGQDELRGARVAEQQINALGGILGKQFALQVIDDGSDPAVATSKVQEAATQGIVVGVGPSLSTAAVQMRDMVASGQVLYISPSASSPAVIDGLTDGQLPFLRTTATDDKLAKAIGFVVGGAGRGDAQSAGATNTGSACSGVTILYTNDQYGKPIADVVKQRALGLSIKLYGLDSHRDERPISPTVQTPDAYDGVANGVINDVQANEGPQDVPCQVVVAPPAIAANYLRGFASAQARFTDPVVKRFVSIGADLYQGEFLTASLQDPADTSSPFAAEGVYVVASSSPVDQPRYSVFRNIIRASFPDQPEPGRYTATAYDATILLALAIQAAGTATDTTKIRTQLLALASVGNPNPPEFNDHIVEVLDAVTLHKPVHYIGASGSVDFDPKTGDVSSEFSVWRASKAQFDIRRTFRASETN